MRPQHPCRTAGALAAAAVLASGCSLFTPAQTAKPAAAPPAPAQAASPAPLPPAAAELAFATMKGARTEQGGQVDAYAYAERPGDAVLGRLGFAAGVAVVNGAVHAQRGSSWGGVALNVNAGPGSKVLDLAGYRAVRLQLAGTAPTLRVRLMGPQRAVRDSGCYPVAVVPVTRELREVRIELARFASESFCGTRAVSAEDTAAALAAIEIADPQIGDTRRELEFRVGRIVFER